MKCNLYLLYTWGSTSVAIEKWQLFSSLLLHIFVRRIKYINQIVKSEERKLKMTLLPKRIKPDIVQRAEKARNTTSLSL